MPPLASIAVANQQHAGESTAAEAATWANLADVLQWVEMPGDVDDASTPSGSLLAMIGAPHTVHWRSLSTITEAEFSEALTSWTIGVGEAATPPSLWQRALAKLAAKAARIAGGTELRSEIKASNAQAALVIQLTHAQAANAQAVCRHPQLPGCHPAISATLR